MEHSDDLAEVPCLPHSYHPWAESKRIGHPARGGPERRNHEPRPDVLRLFHVCRERQPWADPTRLFWGASATR